MKKIFFLILVCLIKLNAYEYEIYYNPNLTYDNKYIFLTDATGHLRVKRFGSYLADFSLYGILYNIEHHNTYFIDKIKFSGYYKNDLIFLNDLYTTNSTIRNSFFNYLYNENDYSQDNNIYYQVYQILYNSEGLAVESIVNGKWAGLYDDSGLSGNLFNEKGDLIYVNGVHASFFDRINDKLLRKFKINLESIFIKKIFYPLLVLIFACVILRSVIRMAFQAFLIRFYDKKISQLEKRREKIENA